MEHLYKEQEIENFYDNYHGKTVTKTQLGELVASMPEGILLCVFWEDGNDGRAENR